MHREKYIVWLESKNKRLKIENKRLNELVFAYESVKAPVNPLLVENEQMETLLLSIKGNGYVVSFPDADAIDQILKDYYE